MVDQIRIFADRVEAGRLLAERLAHLRGRDVVVLGLPRGGVVVAAEVARVLGAPLDVIIVRKLGAPMQPELAMGAIGEGGVRVLNHEVLNAADVTSAELAAVEREARAELARREALLRRGASRLPLTGRTAVLVDDGIATGATASAACQVSRAQGAARVVLTVPVAATQAVEGLRRVADEVISLQTPPWLGSIGQWYGNFAQTTDEQVVALLRQGRTAERPGADGEAADHGS